MADSIRWRVFDRQGNQIYLTQERWQHIIEVDGHPEMEDYEEDLKETIRQGQRRQIPLQPQKYEYSKAYSHLVDDNTHFKYDEVADTLYITFVPGKKATGLALNDQVLLQVDKQTRQAVGVTIFDYSYLAQPTEIGVRSLPLTGLAALSDELRALALEILQKPPVNAILLVSTYSPSVTETVPITLLQTEMLAAA